MTSPTRQGKSPGNQEMQIQAKHSGSIRNEDRIDALTVLDPGRDNPGYWNRIGARIMDRVAFELARRRAAARASVAQTLCRWSRSLIPAAVAAAVIAALWAASNSWRTPTPPEARLVLQDMLGETADESGFEALLVNDRTGSAGAFMALVEGAAP